MGPVDAMNIARGECRRGGSLPTGARQRPELRASAGQALPLPDAEHQRRWSEDKEWLTRAEASARRALEIDPKLAEAHFALEAPEPRVCRVLVQEVVRSHLGVGTTHEGDNQADNGRGGTGLEPTDASGSSEIELWPEIEVWTRDELILGMISTSGSPPSHVSIGTIGILNRLEGRFLSCFESDGPQ